MDGDDVPESARRAALARRVRRFDAVLSDRMASEVVQLPFGVARTAPDLHHVHDVSHVEVTTPVAKVELMGRVEVVFTDAGLAHRRVTTTIAEVAWTLAPALTDLGWEASRLVFMVHDGTTTPSASPLGFRTVDLDTWAAHADAFVADNEWGRSAAVQADMAARDRRLASVVDTHFVLADDHDAGCHVYRHGQVAQIENVHVLSEARGRGMGTGLMAAAMGACADAGLVFLIADADGWPQHWYARLGFSAVAAGWAWTKPPVPPA